MTRRSGLKPQDLSPVRASIKKMKIENESKCVEWTRRSIIYGRRDVTLTFLLRHYFFHTGRQPGSRGVTIRTYTRRPFIDQLRTGHFFHPTPVPHLFWSYRSNSTFTQCYNARSTPLERWDSQLSNCTIALQIGKLLSKRKEIQSSRPCSQVCEILPDNCFLL